MNEQDGSNENCDHLIGSEQIHFPAAVSALPLRDDKEKLKDVHYIAEALHQRSREKQRVGKRKTVTGYFLTYAISPHCLSSPQTLFPP